jgi:hypothetical protein
MKISLYKLIYSDGSKTQEAKIHAPSEKIAREHAESNEYIASLTFVSSEVIPDIVHNTTS